VAQQRQGFNLVLGLYIAICFFCALYLLATYRLPHDSPEENIGVPRMLFGLTFLGLGLYLLPGMLQADAKGNTQRPKGAVFAWISSFILSDNEYFKWTPRLNDALAKARATPNSRIFIDFTGVNCTNCDYNEKNVFPEPAVMEQLERFVLLKLYTDTVPKEYYRGADRGNAAKHREEADLNREFQLKHFGTEQLPLYVVIEPAPNEQGWRTIEVYPEGKINDIDGFVEFLERNAGAKPK
jgi:thiol:disulfide interchange protein DsbD